VTSPPTKNPSLAGTWPLFDEDRHAPFPADPSQALTASAPEDADLQALDRRTDFLDIVAEGERDARRRVRESLPPAAPDWMRAARALADWLETRIANGSVDPVEQAAIARTWAAWAIAGSSEAQIMRVAHLVGRAHTALRDTQRKQHDLQAAYHDAAGVLHSSLPPTIRDRMPFERVLHVARRLRQEADHWAAMVEGTSELLGWTDYARVHAASIIRAVIERGR
jgi:hypothetical protein